MYNVAVSLIGGGKLQYTPENHRPVPHVQKNIVISRKSLLTEANSQLKESLNSDGQQFHQYQQNNHLSHELNEY
jgi:hypothetical protein